VDYYELVLGSECQAIFRCSMTHDILREAGLSAGAPRCELQLWSIFRILQT
jgi:hypothetical protein